MGQMVPVSGNWCWISSKRTDLRYALTHGWRFAIIFSTIGIYIYVYWYMTRHFAEMATSKLKGSYDLDPNSNSTGATGTTSSSSRGYQKPKKKGFEVMYDEELELDHMQGRRPSHPAGASNFPGRPTKLPGNNPSSEFAFEARNDSVTKTTGAQVLEEEEIAPHESLAATNSGSALEEDDLHLPMQGKPKLFYLFPSPLSSSSAIKLPSFRTGAFIPAILISKRLLHINSRNHYEINKYSLFPQVQGSPETTWPPPHAAPTPSTSTPPPPSAPSRLSTTPPRPTSPSRRHAALPSRSPRPLPQPSRPPPSSPSSSTTVPACPPSAPTSTASPPPPSRASRAGSRARSSARSSACCCSTRTPSCT